MKDAKRWVEFWVKWRGQRVPDILVVVPVESEKAYFAMWENDEVIREEESYVEVRSYLDAQHYELIRRMEPPSPWI